MIKSISIFGMMGLLFLIGCSSSGHKARRDLREKQASSAGLYCEWVDGSKHSDIDVELNLQMAKRCDSNKAFTLTPYKNSADVNGIVYCCATAASQPKTSPSQRRKATTPSPTPDNTPAESVETK